MNKEQLELMQEIWHLLPREKKTNVYWKSPAIAWIPGIPNIPILDEGWCLRWLLDKHYIFRMGHDRSDNSFGLVGGYWMELNTNSFVDGKPILYVEGETSVLTALLKLVLAVMKEEVK